ncbi:DnaJ domain-containing protein [Streptomyces sp. NPDC055692]|uniref:J domain-containing protein n=1 Tax=Streptomyces sp. NPDC055692 TaxID=3155683 RepID=UPI00343CDC5A
MRCWVEPSATLEVITSAFRRQVRPDTQVDAVTAERFGRLRSAYETLRDPGRRAAYDQSYERTYRSPVEPPQAPAPPDRPAGSSSYWAPQPPNRHCARDRSDGNPVGEQDSCRPGKMRWKSSDGAFGRYRSRHDELGGLGPRGRRAHRHHQHGGSTDHAVGRGVREER